MYLVAQSCPTLCNPIDCSLPGSSVSWKSPGKNTRVGTCSLLQGIFPIQGWNPGLPHCSRILYLLSHQRSPIQTRNCLLNWKNVLVLSSFSGGLEGKESSCSAGDLGLIPGLGRSPEEGNSYPLLYSCLESSMNRGTWQASLWGCKELDMTE